MGTETTDDDRIVYAHRLIAKAEGRITAVEKRLDQLGEALKGVAEDIQQGAWAGDPSRNMMSLVAQELAARLRVVEPQVPRKWEGEGYTWPEWFNTALTSGRTRVAPEIHDRPADHFSIATRKDIRVRFTIVEIIED